MEQREAIPNAAMELSIGTIQGERVAVGRPALIKAHADTFCAALEEARVARHGGEVKRAHYHYQRALEAALEDIDTETLADILESLNDAGRFLSQDEKTLPALRAAVE